MMLQGGKPCAATEPRGGPDTGDWHDSGAFSNPSTAAVNALQKPTEQEAEGPPSSNRLPEMPIQDLALGVSGDDTRRPRGIPPRMSETTSVEQDVFKRAESSTADALLNLANERTFLAYRETFKQFRWSGFSLHK